MKRYVGGDYVLHFAVTCGIVEGAIAMLTKLFDTRKDVIDARQ